MPTVSGTTEQQTVTWSDSPPMELQLRHLTLPDTIAAVMRGVEQASRGEEVEIDPDAILIDDDDD